MNETTQLLPETVEQPAQSFWKSSWNKMCNFFNNLTSYFTAIRQRIYDEERASFERTIEAKKMADEAKKQTDEAREKRKQTQLENENQEPIEELTREKFDKERDERWERKNREQQEKWEKENREQQEKWEREMEEREKEIREAAERRRIETIAAERQAQENIHNLELFAAEFAKSQVRVYKELTYALECTRDCFQMIRQSSAQLSNLVEHLFRENASLKLYIYQTRMLNNRINLQPQPQFNQIQISAIQRAIKNEQSPMLEMPKEKEQLHE